MAGLPRRDGVRPPDGARHLGRRPLGGLPVRHPVLPGGRGRHRRAVHAGARRPVRRAGRGVRPGGGRRVARRRRRGARRPARRPAGRRAGRPVPRRTTSSAGWPRPHGRRGHRPTVPAADACAGARWRRSRPLPVRRLRRTSPATGSAPSPPPAPRAAFTARVAALVDGTPGRALLLNLVGGAADAQPLLDPASPVAVLVESTDPRLARCTALRPVVEAKKAPSAAAGAAGGDRGSGGDRGAAGGGGDRGAGADGAGGDAARCWLLLRPSRIRPSRRSTPASPRSARAAGRGWCSASAGCGAARATTAAPPSCRAWSPRRARTGTCPSRAR